MPALLAALLVALLIPIPSLAQTSDDETHVRTHTFSFVPKEHSVADRIQDAAIVFGAATVLYPITQPAILDGETGSWRKYKNNFGRLVFDQDEPVWNFLVHPLSGSQMFLFFRARGYETMDAVVMTAVSSALFEFTIEIFSEPASAQDLFNTPVLGSLLGYGIEKLSFSLLNSGDPAAKVLGHIINPCTLFSFHTGRAHLTPQISAKSKALYLSVNF